MQFSVKVKQQKGTMVCLFRGQLVRGWASECLFELLTRSHRHNVVLDLEEVSTFDTEGLRAVAFCGAFLSSCLRPLVLRNAPPELARALREQHGATFGEARTLAPTVLAGTANCAGTLDLANVCTPSLPDQRL